VANNLAVISIFCICRGGKWIGRHTHVLDRPFAVQMVSGATLTHDSYAWINLVRANLRGRYRRDRSGTQIAKDGREQCRGGFPRAAHCGTAHALAWIGRSVVSSAGVCRGVVNLMPTGWLKTKKVVNRMPEEPLGPGLKQFEFERHDASSGGVPSVTVEQMIEVDRAMAEDFRIELIQMMENAGRNLAHLARQRFLNGTPIRKKIVVLVGSGGNGGGALVCARYLHNWGAIVQVFITTGAPKFKVVPAHQLEILRRMKIDIFPADKIQRAFAADLIIDGVLGYSLKGAPRDAAADLIRWANANGAPILALDVPSGMDATTGQAFDPTIHARATLTLALPKAGICLPDVAPLVGELYLADLSAPPALYFKIGLSVAPLFAEADIIRLR
jgi:NAD(P)H-hydrate epimerase